MIMRKDLGKKMNFLPLLDTTSKAVVVNAGTPMVLGFTKDVRDEYVKRGQLVDVGIAEENGIAMASGIAKNRGAAVFGTLAPFFQRTYDPISHDLCLMIVSQQC